MCIWICKALELSDIIYRKLERKRRKGDCGRDLWDFLFWIRPDYLAYKMPGGSKIQWYRNRKYPKKDKVRMPNQGAWILFSKPWINLPRDWLHQIWVSVKQFCVWLIVLFCMRHFVCWHDKDDKWINKCLDAPYVPCKMKAVEWRWH